jgi:hypothetical protein
MNYYRKKEKNRPKGHRKKSLLLNIFCITLTQLNFD